MWSLGSARWFGLFVAVLGGSAGWAGDFFPEFVASNYLESASSITHGDLNGDAAEDLVITSSSLDSVTIVLGGGSGALALRSLPVSSGPVAAAVADLDGDGDFDVAVANSATGNIAVLRNAGPGLFHRMPYVPISATPAQILACELTEGGNPELAVLCPVDRRLVTLRSNGGDLTVDSQFGLGGTPKSFDADDLDGDGDVDLVVATSVPDALTVFRNDGLGNLTPLEPFSLPDSPADISLGELDGDGDVDVFVALTGLGTVGFSNDGAGDWDYALVADSQTNVSRVQTCEFAGDARSDLLLQTGSTIRGLGNLGQGRFASVILDWDNATAFTFADTNGDGTQDLALVREGQIRIIPSQPDGGFSGFSLASLGTTSVIAEDVNGDGCADIFSGYGSSYSYGSSAHQLINDGEVFFSNSSLSVPGQLREVAAGDLVGGPDKDLVAATAAGVMIVPSEGMSMGKPVTHYMPGEPLSVCTGDFDGVMGGDCAAALADSVKIALLLNRGAGQPLKLRQIEGLAPIRLLRRADVWGDSRPELIALSSLRIAVLGVTADGALDSVQDVPTAFDASSIELGDLEGDGDLDVAIASTTQIQMLVNDHGALVSSPEVITLPGATPTASDFAFADMDGDNRADLVVLRGGWVQIWSQQGGHFPSITANLPPDLSGYTLTGLLVADFNGDGRNDLSRTATGYSGAPLSVQLNWGGLQFGIFSNVGTPTPQAAVPGDFDGDSDLDLLALDSSRASSLGNLGSGEFSAGGWLSSLPSNYGLRGQPQAGDFDGDGDLDAVAMSAYDTLLLRNRGDAGFSIESIGSGGNALAAGDIDADGDLDVVITTGSQLRALWNDGHGVFTTSTQTLTPSVSTSAPIYLDDLDDDGDLDLVTVAYISGNVAQMINQGDSYGPLTEFASGSVRDIALGQFDGAGSTDIAFLRSNGEFGVILDYPSSPEFVTSPVKTYSTGRVQATDLNGDGATDLIFTLTGIRAMQIAMNDGAGNFALSIDWGIGATSVLPLPGDYDGDGDVDLAVFATPGIIHCLMNDGEGGFPVSPMVLTGTYPDDIAAGDLNGDLWPDLAVGNASSNSLDILLGQPGNLHPHQSLSCSNPSQVLLGNFDNVAAIDILTASLSGDLVEFYRNSGVSGFSRVRSVRVGNAPQGLAAADFDQDGDLDPVTAEQLDDTATILWNNGTAQFPTSLRLTSGDGPFGVVTGDFNGDARPDLAVVNKFDDTVTISLQQPGTAVSFISSSASVGDQPLDIVVLNVDQDTDLDLAVVNFASSTVGLLINNGAGGFSPGMEIPVDSGPAQLAVGDINGDSHPDLVTTNYGDDTLSVLLGDGQGHFTEEGRYPTDHEPNAPALADFNRDGLLDVAVANFSRNTVWILLNRGIAGGLAGLVLN